MFESLLNPMSVAGTLSMAYVGLSVALGHRFTSTRSRSNAPAVEGRIPAHECVTFPSRDGLRIAAWYVPASAAAGAVILVHGRGAHKGHELEADPLTLVADLVASGLSVLAIDLRGHGDSDHARLSYGYHERLDVLGAFDWLRARGYHAGRIGVLGASMGGAAAIAAAAEETGLGAVVTDCAFGDFGAVLRRNFPRVLPLRSGTLFLPGTLLAARAMVGVFMHSFRPAELACRLRDRPMLVIHAAGDPFIPVSHARAIAEAAGAQSWISDCDRHVGSFVAEPEAYRRRVTDFFRQALALASPGRSG